MAINVYTVLSEFKFDVGHAVTSSDILQQKVDGISNSAKQAKESLYGLGVGFIQSLSGYQAGLLGLFGTALKSSDKFSQAQLSFTTIIDSNMANLSGSIGDMNGKLLTSKKIMDDIAKDAVVFGLPADELKATTELLTAMLVPKGLAGDNFGSARTMSRNLMKSAPNLGLDPSLVQGQLIRAISGDADANNTLFRRLLAEAPEAFRENKVTNAKDFNALYRKDPSKTFDIINKSLEKFSSNAFILQARANTLYGTMQRVRDLFGSFNSVLKPLGDVLVPFVVKVLNMGIHWLNTKGRVLVKMMADFMGRFLDDPKKVLKSVDSMADLGGNFKLAGKLSMLAFIFTHIKPILTAIGNLPVIGPVFQGLLSMIPQLGTVLTKGFGVAIMGLGKIAQIAWPLIKIFAVGLFESAAGLMAFLIPLQGLSRALSRIKIESVEWLADNSIELAEITQSLAMTFEKFMMPINDMIQGFEELFFILLGGTSVLDFGRDSAKMFADSISIVADFFHNLYAGLTGMIAGLSDVIFRTVENIGIIISNLKSGNILNPMDGTKNVFAGYMEAGSEQYFKTLNRTLSPVSDGDVDNAKVSNHNHQYDVKMTNNFKEVLQPDRIAFTIADQLSKASQNRTQSQPSTLSKGMAL